MKSHKVVGVGNSVIKGREVSCYYPECLTEDICKNWRQESKKKADEHLEELMMATPNENTVHVVSRSDQNVKYQTNDFVAARYDYKPYIGKIVDCDEYEFEYENLSRKRISHCISDQQNPIVFGLNSTMCSLSSMDQQPLANQADTSGEAKLAEFGD